MNSVKYNVIGISFDRDFFDWDVQPSAYHYPENDERANEYTNVYIYNHMRANTYIQMCT